ncbi:hypothetical protein PHLGIDRAFT_32586 [Phlebiopsis gigantea 11061_1 CR5-6]|uniref:Uncharacterized protein n=1 Tax=Phlebiopsis gigantea (strain 11061_1 CR5-6) TaxID=745531 RepID=A0A0C3RYE3_PHLG1|nr:hypothetical protein PHLGIDRAFT_32586 [Phlebiopsis gigantea 11061_1 CR5-6]
MWRWCSWQTGVGACVRVPCKKRSPSVRRCTGGSSCVVCPDVHGRARSRRQLDAMDVGARVGRSARRPGAQDANAIDPDAGDAAGRGTPHPQNARAGRLTRWACPDTRRPTDAKFATA